MLTLQLKNTPGRQADTQITCSTRLILLVLCFLRFSLIHFIIRKKHDNYCFYYFCVFLH